jgi:site-specific recombinase XerC
MTNALVLAPVPPESSEAEPQALTPAQARLRKMVLDTVPSPHSKRNYSRALDDLFAFCACRPLSRSLLMEWRAAMESLSPSTINVRLSAVRKLVGEARRAGMIGQEDAASLTDIPNISQKGTRLGNWLNREQAKELLAVPDRTTLKGKRDYVILALLVGCALRRNELDGLDVETIQQREGRWVLADLEGKGRRIRTVAVPIWVKQGIDVWTTAAGIDKGRLLRSVSKSGKVNRDTLSDWAVWSLKVNSHRSKSASSTSAPTTCAAPARSSAVRTVGIWSRSSSCWGTPRSRRQSAI